MDPDCGIDLTKCLSTVKYPIGVILLILVSHEERKFIAEC